MSNKETVQSQAHVDLGNEISDVINKHIKCGMRPDEAISVVMCVGADYARSYYDNEYLKSLSELVVERGTMPLPRDLSVN